MTALLALSLFLNLALLIAVRALSTSAFGVFSPATTRLVLALLSLFRVRRSVVAYDIRKMHELNAVLGYDGSTRLIARLVQVRRSRLDFVGQYGGDEFVVILPENAGMTVAHRIMERAVEVTSGMTPSQREELSRRTGGIVDGVHVAMACCLSTRNACAAAKSLIERTERMKERGALLTLDRATTGNHGTLFEVV